MLDRDQIMDSIKTFDAWGAPDLIGDRIPNGMENLALRKCTVRNPRRQGADQVGGLLVNPSCRPRRQRAIILLVPPEIADAIAKLEEMGGVSLPFGMAEANARIGQCLQIGRTRRQLAVRRTREIDVPAICQREKQFLPHSTDAGFRGGNRKTRSDQRHVENHIHQEFVSQPGRRTG